MQGGFCAEKPYMDGSGASLPRVPESIQARIKRLFLPAAIILQAQGKVNRCMGSKHGNTREGEEIRGAVALVWQYEPQLEGLRTANDVDGTISRVGGGRRM